MGGRRNGMVGRDRDGPTPSRPCPGRKAADFFKILLPGLAAPLPSAIGVSGRRRGGRCIGYTLYDPPLCGGGAGSDVGGEGGDNEMGYSRAIVIYLWRMYLDIAYFGGGQFGFVL